MTTQNLKNKIIQYNQKKNLIKFNENLNFDEMKELKINALYFPDSSYFIESILEIRRANLLDGMFISISKVDAWENVRKILLILSVEPILRCLFQNFSIMDKVPVSELPVLEIDGGSVNVLIDEISKKNGFVHVFLCATPDLKKGFFFDVSAGDLEISGSDAPIYEIYVWGCDYGRLLSRRQSAYPAISPL